MPLHLHLGHAFKAFGHKVHHALNELENDASKVVGDHVGDIKLGLEAGAKAALDHAPGVVKGVLETMGGNPTGIVDAVEAAISGTKEVIEKTK